MNQLEELFNERLANHSIPPPQGTWDRVATNLSKKNKAIVWMRWAAVLLVGALAVSIITIKRSTPAEIITDAVKITTPNDPSTKLKEPLATTLSNSEKRIEKKVSKKRRGEIKNEAVAATADPGNEPVLKTEHSEVEVFIAEQTVTQPTAESKVASRAMVITYTLDPVIDVAPETAVAEAAKKGSSLEKVVKFARDVKNGDSPIGLRVVKEDLFAQSKKKSPTKTH